MNATISTQWENIRRIFQDSFHLWKPFRMSSFDMKLRICSRVIDGANYVVSFSVVFLKIAELQMGLLIIMISVLVLYS